MTYNEIDIIYLYGNRENDKYKYRCTMIIIYMMFALFTPFAATYNTHTHVTENSNNNNKFDHFPSHE